MILLRVFLLLTLVGCAVFTSQDRDVIDQVGAYQQPGEKVQGIKRFAYACEGCIVGSATESSIKASGLQVFHLEGELGKKLTNNIFDIPVEYNNKVKKWIRFYTKSRAGRRSFIIHAERAGRYAPIMSEIMAQKGLPRDLIYLAMAESGFRNDAQSWASAVGPWQFMSFTGKKFGLKIDWHIDQRQDPFRATVAAGDYLKFLNNYFKDWKLAFSGYNAGEGKIRRAIKRYDTRDFWRLTRGRYLKSETKNYTPKIMALAIIGKNLSYFGFTGKDKIKFKNLVEFETIEVPANTDIYKVAQKLSIKNSVLRDLNPEIRRWYTPLKGSYKLKVPVGKKAFWDKLNPSEVLAKDHKTYRIKKWGDLKRVAKIYRLPVSVLEDLNGYGRTKYLKKGVLVRLPFRKGQNHRKDKMYADVYRPNRFKRRGKRYQKKRRYRKIIRVALKKGKKIRTPKQFYTVKKGDTLWTVAKRTGVGMNTIIRSNHTLLKKRMIRAGDKLAIR